MGTRVRGRDRHTKTRIHTKASSALSPDGEREGGTKRKLNLQVSFRSSLKLKSRRCQRIGSSSLLQLVLNCLYRREKIASEKTKNHIPKYSAAFKI